VFFSFQKVRAFWDIAPCSVVEVDLRLKVHTASIIRGMMEAVRTSETSVCSNETTWRNIPKGSNLHTYRRENLKSHMFLSGFVVEISYSYIISHMRPMCSAVSPP
jgi:hypothetical protein